MLGYTLTPVPCRNPENRYLRLGTKRIHFRLIVTISTIVRPSQETNEGPRIYSLGWVSGRLPDDDYGNRGDDALAAFGSNIPLVDAAMRNASARIGHMLSHGFTASEETRRNFVVAQATLAQSVVDMLDSVRDERMVLAPLNVLLCQRGGSKSEVTGQKRKRAE